MRGILYRGEAKPLALVGPIERHAFQDFGERHFRGRAAREQRFDDIRGEKGTAQQATDIPSRKPFVSSDRRHRSGAAGFNLPVPASGARDRVEERGMVWREAGRVKGVHGELLIKRRSACGKARDSVLARRSAADQRFAVEHGRVDRTEFSARTRCGRAIHCNKRRIDRACAADRAGSRTGCDRDIRV